VGTQNSNPVEITAMTENIEHLILEQFRPLRNQIMSLQQGNRMIGIERTDGYMI
jgi:hypothetical protein